MSGQLRQEIIERFKSKFESSCISLLLEGYEALKNSNRNINEETENNITAQLLGCMKSNPKRYDLQISVDREHYLDSEEIYAGLKDADKSLRIDIKYSTWNSNKEYIYHVEAKNLAENNWKKKSVKTPVDAEKLQKRYIDTGINNFVSGKYSNGCLVGYILEGTTSNIVIKLNLLLKKEKREKEKLTISSAYGPGDFHYVSYYNSKIPILLKHFFLLFPESI